MLPTPMLKYIKKNLKRIGILIGGLLLLLGSILTLLKTTIVVLLCSYDNEIKNYNNPLESFNFNDGRWCAYLVLKDGDKIRKSASNCFILNDVNQLEELKKTWVFSTSNSDMTTVSSYVVFTQNGKIMFRCNIAIDASPGMQNETTGWLEPVDPIGFRSSLETFEEYRWPFLILQ